MPTPAIKKTGVVKRMCSFPRALFEYGERQARKAAKEQGLPRANFSAWLSGLIFKDKIAVDAARIIENSNTKTNAETKR